MTKHKWADIIHQWADGAEVEYKDSIGNWVSTAAPCFHPDNEWRIKPSKKKVDLLAWFTGCDLVLRNHEGALIPNYWKRVPSEDKEIEVE